VALNLKTSAGRDLFLQLLPRFDVLVENFGPGVVERLSIDYDSLRKDNPGLIYATIKGFGATMRNSRVTTWSPRLPRRRFR
jgi:formyl-CoA transferase